MTTTRRRLTRVLCAADVRGSTEGLEQLEAAAEARDCQAIAVAGDLADGAEGYRDVLRTLGRIGVPAFWVPGPDDAPIADYLGEAYNAEVVFPFLHGVHGTAALADGHVLFAGFGGEVSDAPDAPRDETRRLSYPRWEPEYRLKILREFPEHQLVFLFATPPAHKGLATPGSEALTELVGTYRPRLVVCGGEPGTELIGRSLVVAPGSLAEGRFAVVDLHSHEVEVGELAQAAP
jgi:Icc-related predicted phosphoesterase